MGARARRRMSKAADLQKKDDTEVLRRLITHSSGFDADLASETPPG
jgi:hypothetical protein